MGKYFGTDGFRGEAGVTLTADHAYKVGRFLGWYYGMLRQRNGEATTPRIVLSCERLARGEGKGRMWCTVHAKALPVQQFFKALRYRSLKPAEQETGTVPRNELVLEHTL